jgi:hypothetical protein
MSLNSSIGQAKKRYGSRPGPCPKITPHLFFILFFIFKIDGMPPTFYDRGIKMDLEVG